MIDNNTEKWQKRLTESPINVSRPEHNNQPPINPGKTREKIGRLKTRGNDSNSPNTNISPSTLFSTCLLANSYLRNRSFTQVEEVVEEAVRA
ncbi:MAG: hypothetical protein FGF50_10355 [Candidatus Brockarchaeota archaeon]|nr:hypothetical protein [Candidatus Brockarchaeota archaeon]